MISRSSLETSVAIEMSSFQNGLANGSTNGSTNGSMLGAQLSFEFYELAGKELGKLKTELHQMIFASLG
jgi:hypothetical protein